MGLSISGATGHVAESRFSGVVVSEPGLRMRERREGPRQQNLETFQEQVQGVSWRGRGSIRTDTGEHPLRGVVGRDLRECLHRNAELGSLSFRRTWICGWIAPGGCLVGRGAVQMDIGV